MPRPIRRRWPALPERSLRISTMRALCRYVAPPCLKTTTSKWYIYPTMAFIVPRKNGPWEIRETHSTPKGPRSTTLASFRELNDEVIERAQSRSSKPLDAADLRRLALRTGAPVAEPVVDTAARQLLSELSAGSRPRRGLRRLLADAIDSSDGGLSDAARAAQTWVAATPEKRGRALRELLLLGDALPKRRRSDHIEFPRLGHA
jgi:hypothetical protein